MSHELRTPLNAIIGFSEVLSEQMFGELNEKQAEYLQDIHASGQHLLSLINDILDLSKIEAGRMELEPGDASTCRRARQRADAGPRARAAARHRARARGRRTDSARSVADERKVKQILLNLLSNAVKFTPDGGRVDVRARRVDGRASRSRCATPASASRPRTRTRCSRSSARSAATTRASRRARASASRSPGASSSCTAADRGRRASRQGLDLHLHPSRARAGGAS